MVSVRERATLVTPRKGMVELKTGARCGKEEKV
jgi:hypothetical protein